MSLRHASSFVAAAVLAAGAFSSAHAERARADAPPCYDGPFYPPALPHPRAPLRDFATAFPTPSFEDGGSRRTVTVTGTATAERAPDTAYVRVRIVTPGADQRNAQCANDRAYLALRTRLAGRAILEPGWPQATTYFSRPPTARPASAPTPRPWPLSPRPNPWERPPYGWVAVREFRIVATPGKQLRDAVDAGRAVHADAIKVQFALTNRAAAYAEALAGAMRDAAAAARAAASAEHARLRIVRAEVARLNEYWLDEGTDSAPVVATPPPLVRIEVRAALNVTFALSSAAGIAAPVLVVHASGTVSRPPDIASVTTAFSDAGNDRTALLHRAETTYDALFRRLRALGIDPSQIPHTTTSIARRVLPARRPSPLPDGWPFPPPTPGPYSGYAVAREVIVNRVPLAKIAAVVAAFAAASAKSAEVAYVVQDQHAAALSALADARRNADAQAKATASAAGLRLAGPPRDAVDGPDPFLGTNAFSVTLTPGRKLGIIVPPSHLDGRIQVDFTYELAR